MGRSRRGSLGPIEGFAERCPACSGGSRRTRLAAGLLAVAAVLVMPAWNSGRDEEQQVVSRSCRPPGAKPVDRPASGGLPAYKILSVGHRTIGSKSGEVLIPTLSRTTSPRERESVARNISRLEGIDELSIYSSEEAYRANISVAYSKQHPEVLRRGFLGLIRSGRFTSGEEIVP